jgi:hypothetical protein
LKHTANYLSINPIDDASTVLKVNHYQVLQFLSAKLLPGLPWGARRYQPKFRQNITAAQTLVNMNANALTPDKSRR